jgi:hypothetical protein
LFCIRAIFDPRDGVGSHARFLSELRYTLLNFGLKVGVVGAAKFEGRIKELVEHLPDLATVVEPLLIVRRVLHEQLGIPAPGARRDGRTACTSLAARDQYRTLGGAEK